MLCYVGLCCISSYLVSVVIIVCVLIFCLFCYVDFSNVCLFVLSEVLSFNIFFDSFNFCSCFLL